MEVIDKRCKENASSKPSPEYDNFRPTIAGFQPAFDTVLLRELKLQDESLVVAPDAFAEPTLFGEIIASRDLIPGDIVRFLANVGTTITFVDGKPGHRYLTLDARDIIGSWAQ